MTEATQASVFIGAQSRCQAGLLDRLSDPEGVVHGSLLLGLTVSRLAAVSCIIKRMASEGCLATCIAWLVLLCTLSPSCRWVCCKVRAVAGAPRVSAVPGTKLAKIGHSPV